MTSIWYMFLFFGVVAWLLYDDLRGNPEPRESRIKSIHEDGVE